MVLVAGAMGGIKLSIYILMAFVDSEGKEALTWDNLREWKKANWLD